MTATAHALVSGALAAHFSDPITAVVLALTSHYIMDSIPHWDFGTNWRQRSKKITGIFAIAETAFGIVLSYIIFGTKLPLFHWAVPVVFGLLPDWLETPWYIFYAHHKKNEPSTSAGMLEKLAYAFYKVPNIFHSKAQLPLGLVTQVLTVLFFLVLLG